MNRTDWLILVAGVVMLALAGGIWALNGKLQNNFFVMRPLQPDPEMPVFRPAGYDTEITRMDTAPGADDRDRLRQAVLRATRELRAAPCNEAWKEAYIQALSAYMSAKLREMRSSGDMDGGNWQTPADGQIFEYLDRMQEEGYITMADYRQMMRGTSMAAALTMPEGGPDTNMYGVNACENRRNGVPVQLMPWEERSEREQRRIDRRRDQMTAREREREVERAQRAAQDAIRRMRETHNR